jgi:hypothetical protein
MGRKAREASMSTPDPSIAFRPFADPVGWYHPDSPLVQGWEQPLSTLSEEVHPGVEAFRAALDIPQGREIWHYAQGYPLHERSTRWQGYVFEYFGTYAIPGDPREAPRFWPHSPPRERGPGYTARQEEKYPSLDNRPLITWLRLVRYQDRPLWVEARWHPTFGLTVVMRGLELEHDARKTSIDQARKGIALLKALAAAPGGRPPDFEDKAAFWQFYWDSYQKVLAAQQRDGNKLPTKTQVTDEMLISVRSLKRYRDRHELPWPPQPPP